ncbi:MAG: hypothetical protein ACK55Z_18465 [bacterium]
MGAVHWPAPHTCEICPPTVSNPLAPRCETQGDGPQHIARDAPTEATNRWQPR